MINLKDTERSCVRLAYNGQVFKQYRGHQARQRFENEIRVLRHLDAMGCNFVPRLVDIDSVHLQITQTHCGYAVERLTELRLRELFESLHQFGVDHGDPELRNVTYRASDGCFCIVDFEFATIRDSFDGVVESMNQMIDEELTRD